MPRSKKKALTFGQQLGVKGVLKVLIVSKEDMVGNAMGTDVKAVRDVDVVISGRVVTKHRFGMKKRLTNRELERVRAGDYSPLLVK